LEVGFQPDEIYAVGLDEPTAEMTRKKRHADDDVIVDTLFQMVSNLNVVSSSKPVTTY